MTGTAYVIVEHTAAKVADASLEAAGLAARLATGVVLVVPGDDEGVLAADLSRRTGLPAAAISGAGLAPYTCEAHTRALEAFFAERKPAYILVPHTTTGAEFAPLLAARTGAFCATAIEAADTRGEQPVFTRSVFNGKFTMRVSPEPGMTAVLTILPGAFEAPAPASGKGIRVEEIPAPGHVPRTVFMERIAPAEQEFSITEAEVIVAAGRGVGEADNMEPLRILADRFTRGAVAGSRAVCDAGWLPYPRQVGVTGKTVSPKLYLACGISGAYQHVAGMRGSGLVVAVNTDPAAPIFQNSDYAIVEDLTEFIPLFNQYLEERYEPKA
ncbi:MAG: electron transfer flavoprotein subunit alpha/FixB family protein [Desulfatibacillaceae bacterium]